MRRHVPSRCRLRGQDPQGVESGDLPVGREAKFELWERPMNLRVNAPRAAASGNAPMTLNVARISPASSLIRQHDSMDLSRVRQNALGNLCANGVSWTRLVVNAGGACFANSPRCKSHSGTRLAGSTREVRRLTHAGSQRWPPRAGNGFRSIGSIGPATAETQRRLSCGHGERLERQTLSMLQDAAAGATTVSKLTRRCSTRRESAGP
jgi:hypothetical protein